MALEDLEGPDKFLAALVRTNPTDIDPLDEGDDHIRGVKNVVLNSLGIMTELMTWPAGTPIHIPNVIDGLDGGDTIQLGRTVRARPNGLDVVSETDAVRIELSASGGLRAAVDVDSAGNTIVRGNVVGAGLALGVEGAAGSQLSVEVTADGGVGLNHAGVRQIDSVADGAQLVAGASIQGTDSGAAAVPLAAVVGDRVELGELTRAAVLQAADDQALVTFGGGEETLLHTGNLGGELGSLIDALFPVGSVYFTAVNAPPVFGGTWAQISEGRFVVGVGTGTDGGANQRTFNAGADTIGRFEVTLIAAELANHGHPTFMNSAQQTGVNGDTLGGLPTTQGGTPSGEQVEPAFPGTPSAISGQQVGGSGGDQAHENSPPAFGLYVWERTA